MGAFVSNQAPVVAPRVHLTDAKGCLLALRECTNKLNHDVVWFGA